MEIFPEEKVDEEMVGQANDVRAHDHHWIHMIIGCDCFGGNKKGAW